MKVSDIEDMGIIARQRRQELRISQADLAALAGVTRQWLTRFERGNSEVSFSKVFAVLGALDLRVRVDAKENSAEKSKMPAYDIPLIAMPRIDVPSILTSGVPPLKDASALAEVKGRIKAIDAGAAARPDADE